MVVRDTLPRATPPGLRVGAQPRSRGKAVEELDAVLRVRLRYETMARTGWGWLADSV